MIAGVDPLDNVYKAGSHKVKSLNEIKTFE